MMKSKFQLILCLCVIMVGSIVFIFFRDKFEKNPNALKFEEYQFNDSIDDSAINYNYYFKIGNNSYYEDTDRMFVYYPKNLDEVNILIRTSLNPEDIINQSIIWRNIAPPFRLVKEKNSDSLFIIKKGMKFLFVKEKIN